MLKNALLTALFSLLVATAWASHQDAPSSERLDQVLAGQPEENRARYPYRHPRETLDFFGIHPGMVVVEALPGGGWYSAILAQYLGTHGTLIGADYALEMWSLFPFGTDEFLARRKNWAAEWPASAAEMAGVAGAEAKAFSFGTMPDSMAGTADAVLFVRALHNLRRFEDKGGYMTAALADAHRVLKAGGIVGVVQHEAPSGVSDEWADGSRGYLKRSAVIAAMKEAGFSLLAESEINTNPLDQPGADDIVWRLPPSFRGAGDDAEKRARVEAIGESNRMTLLFRKD